jgi:hypothetical protein
MMHKFRISLILGLLAFVSTALTQLEPFGLTGTSLTTLTYIPRAIEPVRTVLVAGTDSLGVYIYDFLSPNPAWFNFGLTGKEVTALNVQHWGVGPAELNAIYAAVVPDFNAGDSVILYQQNPLINTPWIPADSGLVFTSGDRIPALGSIHFYGHTPVRPVFAALNSKIFVSSPWINWLPAWVTPGYVQLKVIRTYQSGLTTVVWAGGETGYFQPFFLKSLDDGSTWAEFYPNLGGDNACYSIAINPQNPEVVYAGMEGKVIKTADGGQNWNMTSLQNTSIIFHGLEIDPGNPDHLLAGGSSNVNGFALYETYNAGTDWTEILPSNALPGITAMAADTLNGEFVAYIATRGDGIYRYRSPVAEIGEHIFRSADVQFTLYQNYPNPFNPSTCITYNLQQSNDVVLAIYDLVGMKIQTLVSEFQNAGSHSVNFDASHLGSGMYFYRLKVGNGFSEKKKMLLMK